MKSRRLLDALVGSSGSVILVTASALLRWEAVTPDFPAGIAVGISLGIAVVIALVAGTVDDLPERVGSPGFVVSLLAICLLCFVYLLVVPEPGSTQALVAATGALAVVPGMASLSVANRITNRQLREASTELTVVTVNGGTDGRRWLENGETLVSVTILTVVIVTTALIGPLGLIRRPAPALGLIVGLSLPELFRYLHEDGSEITVTDIGLRVDQWSARPFTRWDDLDGYRVTDDTIELVFSDWYRPTQRFDREEISDEDAFVMGLSEFLLRIDEAGEKIDETGGRNR